MSHSKALFLMFLIFFSTFSLFVISFYKTSAQTSNDGVQVQLMVENCNHNGICEPAFGENFQGCASDCLPPPATTTPPESGGGGSQQSQIIVPNIITSTSSAIISWQSRDLTRGILMWGISLDYEDGTIAEINYVNDHQIKLNNLNPSTRYFYKIESTNTNGVKFFGQGEFFTLPSPDTIPPSNVSNIHIELKNNTLGNYLHISWVNPTDPDFANVQVVRSTDFYSLTPQDGKKVFEDSANSFDDYDLIPDVDYYYSFFSRDVDGNFSSGALAHARLTIISNQVVKNPGSDNFFNQENATSSQTNFDVSNFEASQSGEKGRSHLSISGQNIIGQTNEPIVLSISENKLVPGTKYILISVQDELNPSHFNSYLIRALENENYYEVNLPEFQKEGNYSFFITFLNGDKKVISQTYGVFKILNQPTIQSSSVLNLLHMWISQIMKWLKAFWAAILSI